MQSTIGNAPNTTWLAPSTNGTVVLEPLAAVFPPLEYCLLLAHKNMSPYLARRGEQFNDERWRENAPHADFFLIRDIADGCYQTIGFVSLRNEPNAPDVLHVGDVQIEPARQNRGAGWAALTQIEALARFRGLSALTLNVFRDNPAISLYQRFGFQAVDTRLYKHKMRKDLVA
jgi:ribosomal protein S18 acetylase RimI-like enzyme